MANEDFAASLRASARTEDEYKNHIDEQKRKEAEAKRMAAVAREREEEIALYNNFVDKFKQEIQKGLSEGKFKIDTINGKQKVSGEIRFSKVFSFHWDEEDMGKMISTSDFVTIISNTGVEMKFSYFKLPDFYDYKCVNGSEGSRFFSWITSPEFVWSKKNEVINAFIFNVNQKLNGVAKITDTDNISVKRTNKKCGRDGKLVQAGDLMAHHVYVREYCYRLTHFLSFTVEF